MYIYPSCTSSFLFMSTSPREIKRMIAAAQSLPKGKKAVLATVVHIEGSSYRRRGARMLVLEDGRMIGGISGGCLEGDALRKALRVMDEARARIYRWDTRQPEGHTIGAGLGCRGLIDVLMVPLHAADLNATLEPLRIHLQSRQSVWIAHPLAAHAETVEQLWWWIEGEGWPHDQEMPPYLHAMRQQASAKMCSFTFQHASDKWFVERLLPVPHLVIVGGGYDVQPLIELAVTLGWTCTVVANLQKVPADRFSQAKRLIHLRQPNVWQSLHIDVRTAVVLMSHDFATDLEALRALATSPAPYIGVLGPHKRHQHMRSQLPAAWWQEGGLLHRRYFAPVGLDIGADRPEEIALSILAEIRAVFAKRQGGHLCRRKGDIYEAEDK